jgi:peptidoglycan hydrolase CwlO-like protein
MNYLSQRTNIESLVDNMRHQSIQMEQICNAAENASQEIERLSDQLDGLETALTEDNDRIDQLQAHSNRQEILAAKERFRNLTEVLDALTNANFG